MIEKSRKTIEHFREVEEEEENMNSKKAINGERASMKKWHRTKIYGTPTTLK